MRNEQEQNAIHSREVSALRRKYRTTSWFYDFLDYPWERQYRRWRPEILGDLSGKVFEAGVGTGRNFAYYPSGVQVTGIELSVQMLRRAEKRASQAACPIRLLEEDATQLTAIPSESFDWYVSTFLYCVMPDSIQPAAVSQMARVLKPGGRFRLVEIIYSKKPRIRFRQKMLAPFVESVYGARFDRNTLQHLQAEDTLRITSTRFLRADTYLLIEGQKCV